MDIAWNQRFSRWSIAPVRCWTETEEGSGAKEAERKKIGRNAKKESEPVVATAGTAERQPAPEAMRNNIHMLSIGQIDGQEKGGCAILKA